MSSGSAQEIQAAILRSALEVISRNGYVGATIEHIAQKAGVNSLTVFRHFKDKATLFSNVIDAFAEDEVSIESSCSNLTGHDIVDDLTLLAHAYIEAIFKRIHILRIFVVESPHFPFVRERYWRNPPEIQRHFRSYLAGLADSAELGENEIDLLADSFVTYLVWLVLLYNKLDLIWEYSQEVTDIFGKRLQPQILFFVRNMLQSDKTPGKPGTSKRLAAMEKAYPKRLSAIHAIWDSSSTDKDLDDGSTKYRIERAAIKLFNEKGYARTSTSAIAKEAAVSEASIFRIFGTKAALLYDVYYQLTPGTEHLDLNGLSGGDSIENDLFLFFLNNITIHFLHIPAYRLSLQMQVDIYERGFYYRSYDKILGLRSFLAQYLETLKAGGKVITADYEALGEYMFGLFLINAQEFSLVANDDLTAAGDLLYKFARNYAVFFSQRIRKTSR